MTVKKDICIADYIGNSDDSGNPIGHPSKVLKEYTRILNNIADIEIAIPTNYLNEFNKKNNFVILNNYINVTKQKQSIKDIIRKIKNVIRIFTKSSASILWFTNVDFVLFLMISFWPKRNRKIWCTLFVQYYTGENKLKNKIKNYFLNKGIRKVDIVVTSNRNLNFHSKNTFFLPDYFFDNNFYGKYDNKNKKKQVLCIGIMSKGKDLESLVKTFNKSNIKLKIIGEFPDKKRYDQLKKNAKGNISIEDKYLSTDNYYSLISESQYIILPYKSNDYINRTSGVLLESVFLNTTVIAPEFLLKYNGVKGLDYNAVINDVNILTDRYYQYNNIDIKLDYDIENIINKIKNLMMK